MTPAFVSSAGHHGTAGQGRQPGKRQRLAAAVARRLPAGTYPSPLQPRSARATRPDRDGQRNGHATATITPIA
jgi:hypothetical protein